jgi:hypothetical protein
MSVNEILTLFSITVVFSGIFLGFYFKLIKMRPTRPPAIVNYLVAAVTFVLVAITVWYIYFFEGEIPVPPVEHELVIQDNKYINISGSYQGYKLDPLGGKKSYSLLIEPAFGEHNVVVKFIDSYSFESTEYTGNYNNTTKTLRIDGHENMEVTYDKTFVVLKPIIGNKQRWEFKRIRR